MPAHHQAMRAAYYCLKAAKAIARPLGLRPAASLRVLTYHDVAPHQQPLFAAQLRWLARSWKFISPQQFATLISGSEPVIGRNLLLTFDDSFASQRHVAEQVLKPMGISALFFAVSDFVALQDPAEARQFIAKNIYPMLSLDAVPAHWSNMTWSDLEALLEQGHMIGGHTQTHARLSQVDSDAGLEREIIDAADTLTRRLGVSIDHFAYTFGDLASFSQRALAVARRRFRFIYSGLRGDNVGALTPWAIRREAIDADNSLGLVGAFVEGVADLRYARARAEFARWQ